MEGISSSIVGLDGRYQLLTNENNVLTSVKY